MLAFALSTAQAQDPHFSMPEMMPTAISPAFTGQVPEDAAQRLTTGYRSQWTNLFRRNTFQTAFAGYDTRFCPKGDLGHFGLGLNLLHDRAGSLPLERSAIELSGSFTRKMGKRRDRRRFLSLGAEAGGIFHHLGPDGLRFDEQFDGRDYDASIPGEDFDRYDFLMGDLGIGLLFYEAGKNREEGSSSIGFSYKHLNKPEHRFFDNDTDRETRLPRRLTVHGHWSSKVSPGRPVASVRGMFMGQGPYRQHLLGFGFLQKNGESFHWETGLSWRRSRSLDHGWHDDALVFSLKTEIGGFRFGLSYDVSLSAVRRISNNGAFELAFQYFFRGERDCAMPCPVY